MVYSTFVRSNVPTYGPPRGAAVWFKLSQQSVKMLDPPQSSTCPLCIFSFTVSLNFWFEDHLSQRITSKIAASASSSVESVLTPAENMAFRRHIETIVYNVTRSSVKVVWHIAIQNIIFHWVKKLNYGNMWERMSFSSVLKNVFVSRFDKRQTPTYLS